MLEQQQTSGLAITRRLWTLSTPIIGINVLNVLMLAVDAALCGRLPGRDHTLAALGLSVQVVLLFMTAMLGLLVGTVALVSRAIGTVIAQLQIPLAYVLGFALELGELGVWLSFPIAIAVKASVNFIAYKREHWVVTGVRLA